MTPHLSREELKALVRTVPDFPHPGIQFRDITTLLKEPAGLRAVLLEMARDLKHNSKGFPDLLLWSDTMVEWVEVKAPNDTLSARQLSWLNFFNEHGLPARVLKVSWNAGT